MLRRMGNRTTLTVLLLSLIAMKDTSSFAQSSIPNPATNPVPSPAERWNEANAALLKAQAAEAAARLAAPKRIPMSPSYLAARKAVEDGEQALAEAKSMEQRSEVALSLIAARAKLRVVAAAVEDEPALAAAIQDTHRAAAEVAELAAETDRANAAAQIHLNANAANVERFRVGGGESTDATKPGRSMRVQQHFLPVPIRLLIPGPDVKRESREGLTDDGVPNAADFAN
jgi:hypothetical protein